jgi:DNA-binding SARP family transcriptional activator
MRRVQQRYRREGTYIWLPDRDLRRFEHRLRVGEGSSILDDVDQALRSFPRWWRRTGQSAPSITGLKVHSDAIEIVVERPIDQVLLPGQLALGPDGRSILIKRLVSPESSDGFTGSGRSAARGASPAAVPSAARTRARVPAPTLVTAGRSEGGPVMVNLEAMGSLAVSGDSDACDGFLRALALELATSRWSEQFDLILVGFGAELERFDRVSATNDVSMVIGRLCQRRVRGVETLTSAGFDTFLQARCAQESGTWDPIIVVCGPSTDEHDAADLVKVASDPRTGSAIVVCGSRLETNHTLNLSGSQHGAPLWLLGSAVLPQNIEAGDLRSATALLEAASRRDPALSSDEPYVNLPIPAASGGVSLLTADDRLPTTGDGPMSSAGPSGDIADRLSSGPSRVIPRSPAKPAVEVAVLGPIEIRGAAREFTRAWAKELVVYLAMHPGGASNESWATALWPDRVMAPSSLHSTASVARRSLGQAPDGKDHLPRSHGRLSLSSSVVTDWDRFVTLATSTDIEQWRTALGLLRGRPFEGLRSTDWPILEGIGPAIEAAVVDLSGRLAGAYLATGRPADAQWAARKGLVVSPYDERLYRMLMRAADADGNPSGVEAVMSELVQLVSDDIEPFDSIHPATIDLYRALSRRKRRDLTVR